MNLLNYLQNLNASQTATLLLWAVVLILLVIGLAFLLTFVKSWIAEKKSAKTSQLFQQTFENCLATLFQSLKKPSLTDQQSDSFTNMLPDNNSQELVPQTEDKSLQLVSDFIEKIKEVILK